MEKETVGWPARWIYGVSERWTDIWADIPMDVYRDIWEDRQRDGQVDRELKNFHTDVQTY